MSAIDTVLNFWFEEIKPSQWWEKDPEFDQIISDRFKDIHEQARQCELFRWRETPLGRLAEIIVLDQFSRNIYRNDWRSFASDPLALALAQGAVRYGADELLDQQHRNFLYLPYMHSESLKVHEQALTLYQEKAGQGSLNSEKKHKVIIERFGRYPHRNKILGRKSSHLEIEFLKEAGSSF
jgi:uncharacterized protein (DUF924 family)